jgi:hypothetical protein
VNKPKLRQKSTSVKLGDNTETYAEYMELLERTMSPNKNNNAAFYVGGVILGAGAFVLALNGGWYNNIVGTLLIIFGLGLVCVAWSNDNEK